MFKLTTYKAICILALQVPPSLGLVPPSSSSVGSAGAGTLISTVVKSPNNAIRKEKKTRQQSGTTVPLFSTEVPVQEKEPAVVSLQENAASTVKTLSTLSTLFESSQFKTAATVFVATIGTYALNNQLGLGPIAASSIMGIWSTLVLPENLAIAAFCGTFAGMAKTAVIPGGIFPPMALGMMCSAMVLLFDRQKWFLGVGGRLGFIAQCACTSQFVLASLLSAPSTAAQLLGSYPKVGVLLQQLPKVALYTAGGAFFMRLWKSVVANYVSTTSGKLSEIAKRLSNSVGAVGATGVLAHLLLPGSLAGPVFCGSFVAMASPARLPSQKSLLAASVLAALCQQGLAGVLLGGWGGKLGTAAFMGVLSYEALIAKNPLVIFLKNKMKL